MLVLPAFTKLSPSKILCLWVLYNAIDIVFNYDYRFAHLLNYSTYTKNIKGVFRKDLFTHALISASTMKAVLIGICAILFCKKFASKYLLALFCWANSFMMVYSHFVYSPISRTEAVGLLYNSSMDATMVAITCPFLIMDKSVPVFKRHFFLIIPAFAIYLSESSVGFAGFGVSMFVYFFATYRKKWMVLIPVAVAAIAIPIMGIEKMFYSGGRTDQYKWAMNWWTENISHWSGSGHGTYWTFGPYIQIIGKHQANMGYWAFMHNDWLQILFELGIIGLILAALTYGVMVWKSRLNPVLLASILTLGAVSVFQMPLRYPISLVIVIMLYELSEMEKVKWK